MNESEWLACTDPQKMLEFLRGKASDRKLRLFACGCCRRYWHLPEDVGSRVAVEVAERFADEQATMDELIHAGNRADGCAGDDYLNRAFALATERDVNDAAIQVSNSLIGAACAEAAASAVSHGSDDYLTACDTASNTAYVAERNVQCQSIRDILGNPFRPMAVDPCWLEPNVVKLAQTIYDDRAFDQMPVVADALEAAGCTSPGILAHCRQPGEHVRGCWVVDLILGKE